MIRSTAHHAPPAVQQSVGQILARVLEERGWSQSDFAAVLDRPLQFVNEILKDKKELTRESAAQVGAALGQTPEFWLQLQDAHELLKQSNDVRVQSRLEEVRLRAKLKQSAPIELLKKRGFLTGDTPRALQVELLELYETPSLDVEPAFAAAARRVDKHEDLSVLQRAWFACVRKQARLQPPYVPYEKNELRRLARTLSQTLLTADDFQNLPERLAKVGVRLVYVEAFPSAKIDGGAMFVDGYPVIGLSGRGKRLDKILFTLLHEIAHILLQHVAGESYIVEDLDDARTAPSQKEREADKEASDIKFPEGFPRPPARLSGPWVQQTASDLGVAPIVVIGHLQYLHRLDWRTTLAKNAPSVSEVLEHWN